MSASELERAFDTLWMLLDGPELAPEYRFDPERRWRLDRAHLEAKVGIELDGGTWARGRHSREPGYSKDCEKIKHSPGQRLDGIPADRANVGE